MKTADEHRCSSATTQSMNETTDEPQICVYLGLSVFICGSIFLQLSRPLVLQNTHEREGQPMGVAIRNIQANPNIRSELDVFAVSCADQAVSLFLVEVVVIDERRGRDEAFHVMIQQLYKESLPDDR